MSRDLESDADVINKHLYSIVKNTTPPDRRRAEIWRAAVALVSMTKTPEHNYLSFEDAVQLAMELHEEFERKLAGEKEKT